MLSIAVCDDEVIECCSLARQIREILEERKLPCIIRRFRSGRELLEASESFDMVFLDIIMCELDGMKTAQIFREKAFGGLLVFVSSSREYVFEAYDVEAFQYLLKPVDEHKFAEVMQRAMWQLEREKEEMSLLIKADGSYMEVLAKNILYAENEARKIVLHTKNMPESSYTFYEKMEVLEKRLGEGFFRSHRGFLVNLREVYKYDATTIQMKNGDKVYLAKQKYNDFVTAYMKYLRSAG